jgi:hypothetical protein
LSRLIAFIAVAVTLILTGVVSGLFSGRWSDDVELTALAREARLPASAGVWTGQEVPSLPHELHAARAEALDRRAYVHGKHGGTATAALVFGRAGPVSVHTPEVCLPGTGFDEAGPPSRLNVPGGEFWVRRFRKRAVVPTPLYVAYGWSSGGTWHAPENARLQFAGSPVLYKLYITVEEPPPGQPGSEAVATDLLTALLPVLPTAPRSP